ncbi:hypothetical protein BDY24DRAFT_394274 [Mrakia frigida]|uniref:uncharacterized protein n=1 Tax=Mrakia frigida TaxID=29902 RepID=UPI003FCC0C6C
MAEFLSGQRQRTTSIRSKCLVYCPPDVLYLIAEELHGWDNNTELRSLASTCRLLREVVLRLLDRDVKLISNDLGTNDAKVDALSLLLFDPERCHRVKTLRVVDPCLLLVPYQVLPRFVAAVNAFSNLNTFAFTFQLVTNPLLLAIFDHPSIVNLEINDYNSRVPFLSKTVRRPQDLPERPAGPLVLRNFVGHVMEDDVPNKIIVFKHFVEMLSSFGIRIPSLGVRYHSSSRHRNHLATQVVQGPLTGSPLPELSSVHLEVNSRSRCLGYTWLGAVSLQPSLRSISVVVRPFQAKSFVFRGDPALPHWIGGAMSLPPSSDIPDHWNRLELEGLTGEYVREEGTVGLELRKLRFEFAPTTVVLPVHLEYILIEPHLVGTLQELRFSGGSWGGDWNLTCTRFRVAGVFLPSLSLISFVGSLTPTPTLAITLACSSHCLERLRTTLPSHSFVSDLLGGYQTIVEVLSWINLLRLNIFGAHIPVGSRAQLVARGRGGRVVLEASVSRELDGSQVEVEDEGEEGSDWRGIPHCLCFGCGETEVDPVEAMIKCGREEVRGALLSAGFDLAGFDSRLSPISKTDDTLSFESFLRSVRLHPRLPRLQSFIQSFYDRRFFFFSDQALSWSGGRRR